MEGYGTDCYAVFNRLESANCEQVLLVSSPEPARAAALGGASREPAESGGRGVDQREGRWRAAINLFDAQARRTSQPGDAHYDLFDL